MRETFEQSLCSVLRAISKRGPVLFSESQIADKFLNNFCSDMSNLGNCLIRQYEVNYTTEDYRLFAHDYVTRVNNITHGIGNRVFSNLRWRKETLHFNYNSTLYVVENPVFLPIDKVHCPWYVRRKLKYLKRSHYDYSPYILRGTTRDSPFFSPGLEPMPKTISALVLRLGNEWPDLVVDVFPKSIFKFEVLLGIPMWLLVTAAGILAMMSSQSWWSFFFFLFVSVSYSVGILAFVLKVRPKFFHIVRV